MTVTFANAIGGLRRRFALPLFVKELTEASARRRTYVVRTLYAGLLFLIAVLFARDVLFPVGDPFSVLGRGGKLYLTVMLIQFAGVYLFLPAITAPSITAEKERNTLGLLFLTKLSPTKIVLEKYLGRVFPMLCLALLSLPLLGVAYSLGGLDGNLLFEGIVRLVATILMVGAIGVACSAWCRTTAGAFLSTWAVVAILTIGPSMAESIIQAFARDLWQLIYRQYAEVGASLRLWPQAEFASTVFFGPLPLVLWLQSMEQGFGVSPAFFARPTWVVLLQTAPLLVVTLASLVAARVVLVRRAEVRPKRYLARAFATLDAHFRDLNDRYAKGIEVIKTRGSLPADDPVAWRETTKTTLGSSRYLIRMLLLVETPVLFMGVFAAGSYDTYSTGTLGLIAGILWLGGGLLVAVKGAGLFTGERTRQSLDVLLTTPLATRAILRQKLAGVWRLNAVCSVPIMTTYLLIAYMHYSVTGVFVTTGLLYVAVAVSITLTHLALPAYLAALIGLRTPTQSRAMLTSVAVLVALCLTGPVVKLIATANEPNTYYGFSKLSLYSPAAVFGEVTGAKLDAEDLWFLLVGNTLLYGGVALALRWSCYAKAPAWLGRNENEPYRESGEQSRRQLVERLEERVPAEVVG